MVKPGPRRRGLKASPERGAGSRLGRLPERSSPVLRLSSPVSCPSSLVSRPKVGNPMGAEPCPYSPEFGAAPFGRCLKIPSIRPSQIETICFDLKRRSQRAIRSFRSITVLRKRSERRELRRGPLWRFLFPISAKRNGVAPQREMPRPNPRRLLRLPCPGRRFLKPCTAETLTIDIRYAGCYFRVIYLSVRRCRHARLKTGDRGPLSP